ncbi:predicted hydrolase or acyltransferase of alpha/beta superfamily [Sanguibacter keddieii DSM 10542]|uniref:Predicted hydrolase or acyltransferase of alpha/beta superfamily n=1 Tax=Sanguibacter keddieii (strain ATCC 51767 / DSM 10542 / NCFB 3025 / ST-74) TaxID=446469 RepID=D1BH41_SANKS|nr:alpha/beta hydrolase [Sanguibacter keddieii]ACZ21761.1 predicted hydrolase or acyltransferase of alpha/beta superfamily [Sanguibacter keddieii DSM 10542]
MEIDAGGTRVHYVEHGSGRPVLVLHGAGVDHREAAAALEPALEAHGGLRRIYPDLPGAGLTRTAETVSSAEDVLDVLFALIDEVAGERGLVLAGHSAGAYYAQAVADRAPERVDGLVLVCPLLAGTRDVPPHRPVVADEDLGDPEFRDYFVVQTPEMLERYQQAVAPGVAAADLVTAERIGQHWELEPTDDAYDGPVLVVAGRQDSTVGYAAAVDLLDRYAHVTLAVVDGAGHALPHETPAALSGILSGWLATAVEHGSHHGG